MHSRYQRGRPGPFKRGQESFPRAVRAADLDAVKAEVNSKANATRVGGISTRINALEKAIDEIAEE